MSSELEAPPRSGPNSKGPLLVAVSLLALAIVEAVVAARIAKPDSGANIGLGMAMFAIVLSAVAVALAEYGRRAPGNSPVAPPGHVAAIVAMLLASLLVLFVGWGILEELA
jgi:hypothetical protein